MLVSVVVVDDGADYNDIRYNVVHYCDYILSMQLEADKKFIDRRFREGILEVQQKCGYKNQILERKLELVHDDLETKETQLGEVMASANLDPISVDTVTRRMEVKALVCLSLQLNERF